MLPEDVEGITSPLPRQRRKVESDREDISDSEGDESDFVKEETEEGEESELSARTQPKSWLCRRQLSSQKGELDEIMYYT